MKGREAAPIAATGGVFFLHGEDEFRKEQAARELVDAHLDPATADFNLDQLRGPEVDLETLASILGTPPMMAEWRVVVIRQVEAFATSSRARDLLLSFAERPPPGLAAILMGTVPSGSRARFYSDLKKRARSTEFRAVRPDDVPGWVVAWSHERHGVAVEESAARALAAGVGTDLGVLAQELAKLSAVVGDRATVTLEDVRAAGTVIPSEDRWKWFDRIGNRHFEEALDGLPVLLSQGESGVGLVIGVTTHLLRMGLVARHGPKALSRAVRGNPRWVDRLAQGLVPQARGWTLDEIDEAVAGLLRADQLLKASSFSAEQVLGDWLLSLGAMDRRAA